MLHLSVVASAILLSVPVFAASSQEHAHVQGEKLGAVHFATSCNVKVAPQFDRAVALLHSFEFGASIRAFNDVFASDSTCAMAQWGIALSRWTNPMTAGQRSVAVLRSGKQAADAATQMFLHATERERGYIRAVGQLYDDFENRNQRTRIVAYERAMNELVQQQPGDTEAKIFHAIALTASALPTDKTYANQLKAGEILEKLWARQPNHPGLAHYIIHSYDYPALAGKARAAARRYADIAPSAAHALHMPSHTFTRLGMWKESIETNGRSRDAAIASGAIAEALHASDYTMYAQLQLGNDLLKLFDDILFVSVFERNGKDIHRFIWLGLTQLIQSPEGQLTGSCLKRQQVLVLPRDFSFRKQNQFFLTMSKNTFRRFERLSVCRSANSLRSAATGASRPRRSPRV